MEKKVPQKAKTKQLNNSKKSKINNPEKLVKEAIEKKRWILLVGGTSNEKDKLVKIAHDNKESMKLWKGSSYKQRAQRPGLYEEMPEHPDCLDLAGTSGNEMYESIKKKIDYFKSINIKKGNFSDIILAATTLFIDNLSCHDKDKNTILKIAAKLREYKSPRPKVILATIIVGLEKGGYFKKLPKAFINLFQVIILSHIKDEKLRSARIPEKTLKKIITTTRKELEEGPGGFYLDSLFQSVSRKTYDRRINPSGQGLTKSTVRTRYYELFPKKKR